MNKFEIIADSFQKLVNEDIAIQMAAYMRNRFKFLGIKTPERRQVYKTLFSADKKCGIIDWVFIDRCWLSDYREFHYAAIDYLREMRKHLRYEDIAKLEKYVRSKQWWDSIDSLHRFFGYIGLHDKRINELMLRWSVDNDFWVRRIAIDHQLNRRDKTDTDLLETILVNNFGSTEFFINKAIGWSLRDYSKTNPGWVRDFIARHQTSLSKLSIREGSKYL